jgi:RNA polymerase sigma-70 factor (ECF subfamily)
MELCIPDQSRQAQLEGKELSRILDAFLREQTPENRMVFLRRYWYVDTIAEIAVRYGISESAVTMRLNRTRAKLAAYLAKEGIKV